MRVSVNPQDPGYTPEASAYVVRCNGVEISHVVTADEDARWLLRYGTDERGQIVVSESVAQTEEMTGNVTLVRVR